jgi:hypothetical protein
MYADKLERVLYLKSALKPDLESARPSMSDMRQAPQASDNFGLHIYYLSKPALVLQLDSRLELGLGAGVAYSCLKWIGRWLKEGPGHLMHMPNSPRHV